MKRYPGVVALDDVHFTLAAGEVHCLVGENGAGKSTLIKILSGALPCEEGSISIDGIDARIDSPIVALKLGIRTIHQDFKLVPELSVAENITLGYEPTRSGFPFIDRRRMHAMAQATLDLLGEQIDPRARVHDLSVAHRQIVEIAKALSRKVRILALDEPTASLTDHERENLFRVVRTLKSEGVGIIYISHRLEEIFEIGDRITVLRDGKNVATNPITHVDRSALIRQMVGREIENEYPKTPLTRGDEILHVDQLSSSKVHNVTFTLHRGEIFGLAGLVGAGRSDLARLIFGAEKKTSGSIHFHQKEIELHSPHEAIRHGIGLLTEDRNRQGLILQMKIRENISLASLDAIMRTFLLDARKENILAKKFIDELNIRTPDMESDVEQLSGGNRQKVILARWLSTDAKLLIFDEPTAGIDVGAKYEIYSIVNRLVERGVGVIVISSDLPELLGICDRIAVMCEGRITGELQRHEFSQEKVLSLATATWKGAMNP